MADVVLIESVETSRPTTFKVFEGKDHLSLPEEVEIGDKGILEGFRNLSAKTAQSKSEWSANLTKDVLGDLNLRNIREGEEDRAMGAHIKDLTGLNKIFKDPTEYAQALTRTLESVDWYKEDNPLLIFGKDLGSIDPAIVPKGVKIIPNEEFIALVHTHRGEDTFSPLDGYMVVEQQFRPDGRPQIPISILVGPELVHVIVAPTDAIVEYKGVLDFPTGIGENWELSKKLVGLSGDQYNQLIDEYIKDLCSKRQLGLYRGSLTDGVLKKVEVGIGKKLKEEGFTQAQINRFEFNPNIPDPDLQLAAMISLKNSSSTKVSQEMVKLVAQDYLNFAENNLSNGQKLRLESVSNNRFWIIPQDGQPQELVEIRVSNGDLNIVFPRKSFYGDSKTEQIQNMMIQGMERYYQERLSDRLPLASGVKN